MFKNVLNTNEASSSDSRPLLKINMQRSRACYDSQTYLVIILFDKESPIKKKKMSDKVMTLPDIWSGTAKRLFRPLSFVTSRH